MKWMQKAAAAVAAVSVMFSLSACQSGLNWAARIDKDTSVPIGLYIYEQAVAYRSGVQDGTLTTSEKLDGQTVTVSGSDIKATEYLDNEARDAVMSHVGACLMAREYKVSLTDEELQTAAESAKSAYETDKAVFEKVGVAQSSVEEYYKSLSLKNNLFKAKYGKDGSDPVTEEELMTYIRANYATISFIQQYFYKDDGTAMSDKEKEALKKEYEKIQAQAEKGKLDFQKKCDEFNKNATSYKGGYKESTSRFDTESEEGRKILALKEGKFTLLVTDSAIALIQKNKLKTSDLKLDTQWDSLLLECKYDAFLDELKEKCKNAKNVQLNEAAFEKFGSATRDFSELSIPSSYY